MVLRTWTEQPAHYPGVLLDAIVVMPEHLHGLVILTDPWLLRLEHKPGRNPTNQDGPGLGPALTRDFAESRERPVDIPSLIGRFKSLTTTRYYTIKDSHPDSRLPEKLWQRSYYERVIRSDSEFEEKREYIVTNHRRWWLRNTQQ
jgi:REP element-mobilizing transposase RayT